MSKSELIDDMGVANVGFLIENLGKDAGECQYLRELVQNSFEAILRRMDSAGGRVEIDFESINGVRKLRITDNGIGMTPEEVRQNINRLSASAGTQAFDKNFGIGAKITAAVRNPHGVMYKTWKDGIGSITVLGRQNGRYGRIGHRNPVDGRIDYWLPLPDKERHPVLTNSGTSVVLLGTSKTDDTTVPPPNADVPSQWVATYLERRYFDLPPGITLRVLRPTEIFDSALGTSRPMYDTIRGQHYYLDKHSVWRGVKRLPRADADVYWWILSEAIVSGGKTWNNRGHVAALYQNELYQVRSGIARSAALKDFGIYAGHGRVVIYVRPVNVLGANTARSALVLKGGGPVDYGVIGNVFADEMPDELSAFMAGQVSAETGDHRRSILKNLREVEAALEFARYRRQPKGELESVQPESGGHPTRMRERLDTQRELPPQDAAPPEPQAQDVTGRVGSAYFQSAREELERLRVRRVDPDPLPQIVWDDNGTSVKAGRAATYTSARHVVTANPRFDLYLDLLEWSVDMARKRVSGEMDEATLRQICQDEVRRWIAEALSEAVVVLRSMAHDERWTPKDYEIALSDEGLTAAAVSHRWLLLSAIKRGLAGRLGRTKEGVEA